MMTVKEFVGVYRDTKYDDEKYELLKTQINNDYVKIAMKQAFAKNIVNVACYTTDESGARHFRRDSVAIDVLTKLTELDLYTFLTRDDNDVIGEFDLLNELRIFDALEELVDERELVEFREVVRLTMLDEIENVNEPHAFIRNQVERIRDTIYAVLTPWLDKLDTAKIEEIIKDVIENK